MVLFALEHERPEVLVQHNAIVTARGFTFAQRASDVIAYHARSRRPIRAIHRAILLDKQAVGVRVRDGGRCQQASEVDAVDEVGEDVVAALFAVVLAQFVVAACFVLPKKVGRCCHSRQRGDECE